VEIVEIQSVNQYLPELNILLQNSVHNGASIGFLPPLSEQDALSYWQGIEADLLGDSRSMLIALEGDKVIGTVQLSMTSKANGRHRAEIEKLMVHTLSRGKGIAKMLMNKAEATARKHGRHLLVLDTRKGDVASELYRQVGYIEAGQIPGFAKSANGELHSTVFFYKQL